MFSINSNEDNFENILEDLDKNISKLKLQLPLLDYTKRINDDKSNISNDKETSLYDLISKYQLDNSNLQYENFYLKKQNKFLENENKKVNEQIEIIKNDLENFNNKIDKFEKIKEQNFKDLNDNYKNICINKKKDKGILKKDKQIMKEINTFLDSKKDILLKLGIKINLKNEEIDIQLIGIIINKLISENQLLYKKINELKSIIKQLSCHIELEKEQPKLIYFNNNNDNKNDFHKLKFQEKNKFTTEQTKENSNSIDRINNNKISKIFYQPLSPQNNIKLKDNFQYKSFTQFSSKILNNNSQNSQDNILINKLNQEKKSISSYNMFKKNECSPKKISLVKGGNKVKNKFIINKRNPLFGLKNKIELLESMLKEANLSQNDNYSE